MCDHPMFLSVDKQDSNIKHMKNLVHKCKQRGLCLVLSMQWVDITVLHPVYGDQREPDLCLLTVDSHSVSWTTKLFFHVLLHYVCAGAHRTD